MKKLILITAILISSISYSQITKEDFEKVVTSKPSQIYINAEIRSPHNKSNNFILFECQSLTTSDSGILLIGGEKTYSSQKMEMYKLFIPYSRIKYLTVSIYSNSLGIYMLGGL